MASNPNETHHSALQGVIKELREKRTELAALAKKTIADLDAKIPLLQNKIAGLQAEEKKLTDSIAAKQEQYRISKASYLAEFEELKAALQKDKEKSSAEFSKLKADAEKAKQEATYLIKEHQAKIEELNSVIAANNAEKDATKKAGDALISEKEKAVADLNKAKASVLNAENGNKQLGENLKAKIAEVNKQNDTLTQRIAQADAVIAKSKEADAKLASAAKTMEDAKKMQEKNNTDAVNNLAERKRLNLRADELNRVDEALKTRENNIKLVEQKIAQ